MRTVQLHRGAFKHSGRRPGKRSRSRASRASAAGTLAAFAARFVAFLALAWAAGFVAFVTREPAPASPSIRTDAIVVLTGGSGRLARGFELLEAGRAGRLLVSGVDRRVRPQELAAQVDGSAALFACCVDLGFQAVDTRSNAEETAAWVRANGFRSVRLVTSAYHMPRARLELAAELGEGVTIVPDAVARELPPGELAREFSKYALRSIVRRSGVEG